MCVKFFSVIKIFIFTDVQKTKDRSTLISINDASVNQSQDDEMSDELANFHCNVINSNNNNNKETSNCMCKLCPQHLNNNKGMDNFY